MKDIRVALEEELSLLPSIEESADLLFTEAGIDNLPPSANEAELRQAKCILVIGRPIQGFARIEEIDGAAHLEQLSVDRHFSGQGIGTRLLEGACKWANDNGYKKMTLITFKNIPWNGPFYAKHQFMESSDVSAGLQQLREHEKDLGLDEIGERVVMERELT